MSAFIVGHDHIDAILTVASRGAYGFHPGDTRGKVSWWRNDPEEVSWQELEERAIRPGATDEELTEIGRMLLTENQASVSYRYPEDSPGELPGTIGEAAANYRFHPVFELDTRPETGFGLIACLRYQSCEHPGWKRSEAFRFCEAFEAAMILRLPGMETAPWEWQRKGTAV